MVDYQQKNFFESSVLITSICVLPATKTTPLTINAPKKISIFDNIT